MSVSKKFVTTGAVLIGLTAVISGVSIFSIRALNRSVQSVVVDYLLGISIASEAEAGVLELHGNLWRHVAATATQDKTSIEDQNRQIIQNINQKLKEYEDSIVQQDDRELFSKVRPAWQRYLADWDSVRDISLAGRDAEAYSRFAQATQDFRNLREAVRGISDRNRRGGDAEGKAALSLAGGAQFWIWLFTVVILGTGSGLLYIIAKSLKAALRRAVEELGQGSRQVASAASQVAASSQKLSEGASEQAASVEETSATSEEISAATRKNADNANRLTRLMRDSAPVVERVNSSLEQLKGTITDMNGSTARIASVVKLIDEIAFQTNILALNAAVEAARAGEAGMGFAVVADEVRNLAQRSAKAAKDTQQLIESSVEQIHGSASQVEELVRAAEANRQNSEQVAVLVGEVALGTEEQARGVEQIARAISQIQQVTQSTAASAEEGAAASQELTSQAEALRLVADSLGVLAGTSAGVPANLSAANHNGQVRHALRLGSTL